MNLPIIDYRSAGAPTQFVRSIRETGFAVLTNTFIPTDIIKKVYKDFQIFFSDKQQKQSMLFDPKTQAGYFPMKSEKAKDSNVMDLKEFFHYFPNGPGVARPSGFVMDELCFSLEDLGIEILGWLQQSYPCSSQDSWSQAVMSSKNTLFRVIHYPPINGTEEPGAVRSAAHEDINFITLLPASTQPGLQVKDRNGNWHDVGTDENSIIVNVGDMLQLLTEGYYPSTTHRVVNPEGSNISRYSMPLFIHPHRETRLSETKTAQQYLEERLKEIGLKS